MNPALERALQECANEPIHLSGAIQPHGYLISCQLPDWTIRHVSANVEALTGWRAEAFGDDALRLCKGEIALSAKGNEVRVVRI